MTVDQKLADSWEMGRVLPVCSGVGVRSLTVVGKGDRTIDLARSSYEGYERTIIIEEYDLEGLTLSGSGGCVESMRPTRTITTIDTDEYWGRADTTKEKQKYIEILREM